jgi:release factor glutamine methyltransferase
VQGVDLSHIASVNIAHILSALQVQGLDRLDAQWLLLHVLNKSMESRAWLLAHDTDLMDAVALQKLRTLVARRLQGEPLAYITGHKQFYGLDLRVDARVLVPRPDTETLVDWALAVLHDAPASHLSVLDLGTGSGAIALALKATRPALQMTAIDFSEDALAVAKTNARGLALDVHFQQGSWLKGVDTCFQVIVSNPPYIAAQDLHLAALTHEPLQALASGPDGLDDIRSIIAQAPARLLPGGWLLLEHGYDQAAPVCSLLIAAGFEGVQSRIDFNGIARCSGGQMASTP